MRVIQVELSAGLCAEVLKAEFSALPFLDKGKPRPLSEHQNGRIGCQMMEAFCVPSEPEVTDFNGNEQWNFQGSGRSEQNLILTEINGRYNTN